MFEDKSIQHVFFDLDHTLWDFETNSKLAISEIYDEFNLQSFGFTLEDYWPVYLRCNEYCWDKYRKNQMNKDLLRHQRFYLSLKNFGISDRIMAKKMGKKYVILSPLKTALMPGVMEVLEYLYPKYPLHIITNGFQEIQHLKLKNTGIDKFFGKIITSEKAGRRKPERHIFEFALKKTSCLSQHALMIGDNLDADIAGAVNAGLHAIWFNHHKEIVEANNFTSIHQLIELKQLL